MKAKCALLIKSGGISQEEFYRRASAAVGRYLTPGFGLSTCNHGELIRVLDAVCGKTATAKAPRAPRPAKTAGNVTRIATTGQFQFARALERELKIGMDEAAGISERACGTRVPRTSKQVGKYTEALKAIRRRRLNRQYAKDANKGFGKGLQKPLERPI